MNGATLAVIVLVGFVLGFRYYAQFLAQHIFSLNDADPTPAHRLRDDVDYVPTNKYVLFGHHFSSIAGTGPIVGPAIAVIWGWLPAIIWVVLGTVFVGAAHDFGVLALSAMHDGKSMGDMTATIINRRSRVLFSFIIFFLLWGVLAIFALVIGVLFVDYPSAVIPANFSILIALIMGVVVHSNRIKLFWPSVIALVLLYAMIFVGVKYPIHIPAWFGSELTTWIVVLLIYSFIASVLPVWLLLQPRDYVNSHQLFLGLGLMFLGLFVARPDIVAPAVNLHPEGAPSWIPFLFVTVACGAISGFHGLVSGGTTAKQLDRMSHAPMIGYGSMLCEGALALMAILACTAGFESSEAWNQHYASWNAASGLGAKVGAFVQGAATFLSALRIPMELAVTIVAVIVICFAATTLDTATRIQRYIIAELGEASSINVLKNRYVASALAAGSGLFLALAKGGGQGGLILWPLFGTTNQLVAGLSLLVISVFLLRRSKPAVYYLIPMVFVVSVTLVSIVVNLTRFLVESQWMLAAVSLGVFTLALWLVFEAVIVLYKLRGVRGVR